MLSSISGTIGFFNVFYFSLIVFRLHTTKLLVVKSNFLFLYLLPFPVFLSCDGYVGHCRHCFDK